jgi:hypothetical protein
VPNKKLACRGIGHDTLGLRSGGSRHFFSSDKNKKLLSNVDLGGVFYCREISFGLELKNPQAQRKGRDAFKGFA